MRRLNASIDLRKQVYDFLQLNCSGRTRAIRAQDLAYKFDTGLREINEVIRVLRLDGFLIGSSKEKPYGYYIPVTEDEIKYYLETYKSELFDMLLVYNRQKRARKTSLENLKSKDLFPYAYDKAGQMELCIK
jgi:hypothetical protein